MNLDTTQKEFWTLLVYCQDKSCPILQLKSKVSLVSSFNMWLQPRNVCFIQVLLHPYFSFKLLSSHVRDHSLMMSDFRGGRGV